MSEVFHLPKMTFPHHILTEFVLSIKAQKSE